MLKTHAKTTVKKAAARTSKSTASEESASTPKFSSVKKPSLTGIKNFRPNRTTYLVLALIGLLLLAYYKKDWFIAATVNGSPVSNFELLGRLNQQYRTPTLNQMINEKIILNEVKKNNITVSNDEVNQKIAELEKNMGGPQALDSLLVQQGQTRDSLKEQVKIQLSIEKLYQKDATVSAEEVEVFVKENKDQLQATDSAGQTKEATEILQQQKLSQVFNQKFQQLKQNAKVQIF